MSTYCLFSRSKQVKISESKIYLRTAQIVFIKVKVIKNKNKNKSNSSINSFT